MIFKNYQSDHLFLSKQAIGRACTFNALIEKSWLFRLEISTRCNGQNNAGTCRIDLQTESVRALGTGGVPGQLASRAAQVGNRIGRGPCVWCAFRADRVLALCQPPQYGFFFCSPRRRVHRAASDIVSC